jgi:ribosomal protein L17
MEPANVMRTRHNGNMAKAKTSAPRKPMSTGHKAALARGRAESACVRHYLEALETSKPKRGRKRTPASIDKRLAAIEAQLASADALTKLHLLQEQKDLTDERARVAKVKDLSALEKQFIKVAEAYGQRKGISYGTWRAAGVSANVLQAAGVSRSRS